MVAIKNMEMPKDCSKCVFACNHYIYGEYYSYCLFDKEAGNKLHKQLRNLLPKDGKSEGCPLEEITPAPIAN